MPIVTSNGTRFDICPVRWQRTDASDAVEAMRWWHWLKEYNTLPVAGGLLEQSAAFVYSVECIDAELMILRQANEAKNG